MTMALHTGNAATLVICKKRQGKRAKTHAAKDIKTRTTQTIYNN